MAGRKIDLPTGFCEAVCERARPRKEGTAATGVGTTKAKVMMDTGGGGRHGTSWRGRRMKLTKGEGYRKEKEGFEREICARGMELGDCVRYDKKGEGGVSRRGTRVRSRHA